MKKATRKLLGLALLSAFAAGSSFAGGNAGLNSNDRDFIEKAAIAGMSEVEQSKLAQAQSSDAKVKAFAETMITDHGKAGDELKALAQKNGWTLPAEMDGDAKEKVEDVRKAGVDVNAVYARNMMEDHDAAVELFTKASNESESPPLREFAKKTLPALKHHQSMSRELPAKKQ